ncbi:Rv3235 family protein [Streptomyces sp. NPDC086081]|uniref:Rv3235 family protein n=1 Tax=Streptomyces sp. NPDC086081 TaxID=3365749 RepID=UPI0037FB340D
MTRTHRRPPTHRDEHAPGTPADAAPRPRARETALTTGRASRPPLTTGSASTPPLTTGSAGAPPLTPTGPPRVPGGGPPRTPASGGRPPASARAKRPYTRPADTRPPTSPGSRRPAAPAARRGPHAAPPPSPSAPGPASGRTVPRVPAQAPRRTLPTDLFADLLVAVLSGHRPVHSMLRHTRGRAYDELTWLAERGPLRTRGARPVVRDIGYFEPRPGAIEAFARIGAGDRLRAMAFRLELGQDLRWRCTAVELGGPRPPRPDAG